MSNVALRSAHVAEPLNVRIEKTEAAETSYIVHVDDRAIEAEVEFVAENRGWLRIHGEVSPFFATRSDEIIRVWIRGREHVLEIVQRTARRAGDAADSAAGTDVIAPMPGTILRLDVSAGDDVDAGEAVAVMESMKMEMTLTAPRAGRVRTVDCKVGELVDMGRVLMALEPAE